MSGAVAGLGWVDVAMLGLLLLSLLAGLWRGLVFELLSLAGYVAAWFAAQRWAPAVAEWLPWQGALPAWRTAAAYVLVFMGALLGCGLAARLLRFLVQASPLGPLDRLLGGGFGLLRGLLALLVVSTLVALTPLVHAPAWQQSGGAAWLQMLRQEIQPVLPSAVARHLPAR
ncbi:CvpA family protein [Azohydromonas aeria]|uniref:CvpA family protein n=1 Tax=Azohydromonas aeria TaxID=2590212 RepID=UPI001E59954A|nr:CvpA family protein [Azohydromonas aeria]